LEHPTTTSLLPLERISKFLLLFTYPTPKLAARMQIFIKLIKSKGDSAFPRKPSPRRELLWVASPPPKKVPFFRKKSLQEVPSTP
jgi:hypothetical protein